MLCSATLALPIPITTAQARPLEDVVAMLKGFKSSSVQREQEVFACMIHNLFDEYRFFPRYPDKVRAFN